MQVLRVVNPKLCEDCPDLDKWEVTFANGSGNVTPGCTDLACANIAAVESADHEGIIDVHPTNSVDQVEFLHGNMLVMPHNCGGLFRRKSSGDS